MSISNKPLLRSCLIIAHGSRREGSNDEVRNLASLMRSMTDAFKTIECAFLEIAQPSIEQGLTKLIAHGSTEIIVVPYFLSSGRHVVTDIPEQIEQIRKTHPDIVIQVTNHIGANPESMAGLLLTEVLNL